MGWHPLRTSGHCIGLIRLQTFHPQGVDALQEKMVPFVMEQCAGPGLREAEGGNPAGTEEAATLHQHGEWQCT